MVIANAVERLLLAQPKTLKELLVQLGEPVAGPTVRRFKAAVRYPSADIELVLFVHVSAAPQPLDSPRTNF